MADVTEQSDNETVWVLNTASCMKHFSTRRAEGRLGPLLAQGRPPSFMDVEVLIREHTTSLVFGDA